MTNFYKLGLIVIAVAILGAGSFAGYRLFATGPITPAPDGAIAIPADLRTDYEPAIKRFDELLKQKEQIDRDLAALQPTIEQTLRITLDRAGVKAADFGKYILDEKDKMRIIPKPAGAPKQ